MIPTTAEIQQQFAATLADVNGPGAVVHAAARARTRELEVELRARLRLCTVEGYTDDISGLDAGSFGRLVREEFYNPQVMSYLQCIVGSILRDPYSLTRLKSWLRLNQQIGGQTSSGYAFLTGLGDDRGTFITKVPRSPDSNLLHEVVVGLLATNPLRALNPNFAYVFANFSCSAPFTDRERRVVSWCEPRDPIVDVSYVLYENVIDSIPLKEYVATCTAQQYLSILLQLVFALQQAYEAASFTHYDLNADNVLVRKLNRDEFAVAYGDRYVYATRLAVIIDYGLSFFEYRDEGRHVPLGSFDSTPYGIAYDRPYPLHDLYKLLGFSLFHMKSKGNLTCYQAIAPLLQRLASREPVDYIVDNQLQSYYHLPARNDLMQFQYIDLLPHLQALYDLSSLLLVDSPSVTIRLPADLLVLGCQETSRLASVSCRVAVSELAAETGLARSPRIHDIYALRDYLGRLPRSSGVYVTQNTPHSLRMGTVEYKYDGTSVEMIVQQSLASYEQSAARLPRSDVDLAPVPLPSSLLDEAQYLTVRQAVENVVRAYGAFGAAMRLQIALGGVLAATSPRPPPTPPVDAAVVINRRIDEIETLQQQIQRLNVMQPAPAEWGDLARLRLVRI